jgi:hypothetical protein
MYNEAIIKASFPESSCDYRVKIANKVSVGAHKTPISCANMSSKCIK